MPSEKTGNALQGKEESAFVEMTWKRIEIHLEDQRHRIYEEIRNYPRPIPACDLQFNHLLQQRAGILQEMARMQEAWKESLEREDSRALLEEYIKSSPCLDGEAGRRVAGIEPTDPSGAAG